MLKRGSQLTTPMRDIAQYAILLLLLIPLLFANMGPSHDWGDDFAQYIHQGINIAEGLPQTQTGYVYNPQNPMMGPEAYPIGFPLMLSAVYALTGNYIANYIIFISIVLIVYLLILYVYLNKEYKWYLALFGVLLIAYNPVILSFKREVMADIPFALLLLALLLIMRSPLFWVNTLLAGLLAGLLLCTKGTGWPIVLAIGAHFTYQAIRQRTKGFTLITSFKQPLILWFLAIGTWFLIQKVLFKVPTDYSSNFLEGNFITSIVTNLAYYQQVGMNFLVTGFEFTGFLGIFSGACALVFIVLGLLKRIQNPRLEDWIFGFYMFVLLVYPYQGSGFRFLLPLIPMLLLYLARGFQEMMIFLPFNRSKVLLVIGLLVVGQFIPNLWYSVQSYGNNLFGPQDPSALQAFSYLEHKLPKGTTIAFAKPRALALFSPFKGFAVGKDQKIYELDKQFEELGIKYYLVCPQLEDTNLERYISVRQKTVIKVWENEKFVLYQRQ